MRERSSADGTYAIGTYTNEMNWSSTNTKSNDRPRLGTILSEEARYGLAVKRELDEYYGSEVNRGRLYPNLDELVEMGAY